MIAGRNDCMTSDNRTISPETLRRAHVMRTDCRVRTTLTHILIFYLSRCSVYVLHKHE